MKLRDEATDQLVRMVTADNARAVLLFGEIGVGRTTVIEEGLLPALQERGILVLSPGDAPDATEGFAAAAQRATGFQPKENERSREFLVRVATASPGQQTIFVIDDADRRLAADPDGRAVEDLGGTFSRVTSMSRGLARFIFSSADVRLHWLDALERRTGTLFPTNARLRLTRFPADAAQALLAELCAARGASADPDLLAAALGPVTRPDGALPADVQLLSRALGELRLGGIADLARIPSGRLDLAWLEHAAAQSGDRDAALRVLGAVARSRRPLAVEAASVAADCAIDVAQAAADAFVSAGVLNADGGGCTLAHEILDERAREIAAPAIDRHQSTRALFVAAAAGGRMPLADWRRVRAAKATPATPEESRAVARTTLMVRAAMVAAVVVPLAILVALIVVRGQGFHFATVDGRLVVRDGHSSEKLIADTGLARDMVAPQVWADPPLVGADYAARAASFLAPRFAAMTAYAMGKDEALDDLKKMVGGADGWSSALRDLEPIATGHPGEVELVREKLADPAVAPAALELAIRVAARKPDAYGELLVSALSSTDLPTRRAAVRAFAELPPAVRAAAYAKVAPTAGKSANEIVGALDDESLPAEPAATAAAWIYNLGDLPADVRDRAWKTVEAIAARDGGAVARALGKLAGDRAAHAELRAKAVVFLADRAAPTLLTDLKKELRAAVDAGVPGALMLYARVDPGDARLVLAGKLPPEQRIAAAQAWGALVKNDAGDARPALEGLLEDPDPKVRAEAAIAYGKVGQAAQEKLATLAQSSGAPVGDAAAVGLAESVLAGGSTSKPFDVLFKLWKRGGADRRRAALEAAELAAGRGAAAIEYLASALHDKDDQQLHAIGVDGLCKATIAGSNSALDTLVTAAGGTDLPVRTRIGACVVEHVAGVPARLALKLVDDVDPGVRAAVAKVLAGAKQPPKGTDAAIAHLLVDKDRGVRRAAVLGLAAGGDKSGTAAAALAALWDGADADERRALLDVAVTLHASDLVRRAVGDADAEMRRRGLRAAFALKTDAGEALIGALSDEDVTMRRFALHLLMEDAAGPIAADRVAAALELALRDADEQVAEEAALRIGAVADVGAVAKRIADDLKEPSERTRTLALQMARGLVGRGRKEVIDAVTPALEDPARGVRRLAVKVLGMAFADRAAGDLGKMMRESEGDAMHRWVYLTALLDAGDRAGADAALSAVAHDGSAPFAAQAATLGAALLAGGADGAGFVGEIVP